MAKVELDALFERMGREQLPPESARSREARRARIVASMRTRHVELVHEHGRWRAGRRRVVALLVAAALAAAGTAGAGVAGVGPLAQLHASLQGTFAGGSGPGVVARPGARAATHAPVAAAPSPPVVAPPELASLPSARARAFAGPLARHEEERQLEAVNRLFADARRARREGRDAEALALLDQLVAKYPRSVLAQEAAVERFRALARLGRATDAARAGRSYLARYPGGFGSEEAERLVEASNAR